MDPMTETIIAAAAVLALIVSVAALVVSLKIANEDATARLEQFEFSWTPLVAVEGGNVGGTGGTRTLDCTVHLEGRGFAHNLILNLFLNDEPAERAQIRVWYFKRAPATQQVTFTYQVDKPGQADQDARIKGTFQNVFKDWIGFTQQGRVSAATLQLELMSGAPEYSWPWKTIKPVTATQPVKRRST
jgi:hypothetical protein